MTVSAINLHDAYNGSYYTILGAGGDLDQWVTGYEGMLEEQGIGKPVQWYKATGKDVNEYINPSDWRDAFPADLTLLFFPLDGLNTGKLAMFKLQMEDKWFDDVVDNARGEADDVVD